MSYKIGTILLGGPNGDWEGRVNGTGKWETVKILWLTGKLKGKEALVCRKTLKSKG